MAASHFKIVCSQKLIRSLTDLDVHICQINRKFFLLKCAGISLLVALVIKGLIKWKSKCHQKSMVLCDGYVKYEEAKVHRSAIMQDFRDFITAKFVMGYPCVRHFVLYSWSSYFAFFLIK